MHLNTVESLEELKTTLLLLQHNQSLVELNTALLLLQHNQSLVELKTALLQFDQTSSLLYTRKQSLLFFFLRYQRARRVVCCCLVNIKSKKSCSSRTALRNTSILTEVPTDKPALIWTSDKGQL